MRNHRKAEKVTAFAEFPAASIAFRFPFVINLRNPVKIPRNLVMSLPESNMAGSSLIAPVSIVLGTAQRAVE